MKKLLMVVMLTVALAACKSESDRAGEPATDTTASTETSSTASSDISATTTASTGGTSANMAPADKEFVSKAGMTGLAEVQMGNIALQKAQSAEVKAYAQRMVTDHGNANAELSTLATNKGLALPAELDAGHKSAADHLNGLSGAEFDKAYMQHMVEDHTKTVNDFQTASTSAGDGDIRAWATKTLPTLQDHLKQAQAIAGKLR